MKRPPAVPHFARAHLMAVRMMRQLYEEQWIAADGPNDYDAPRVKWMFARVEEVERRLAELLRTHEPPPGASGPPPLPPRGESGDDADAE